jgi:hypothetical protein
MAFRSSAEIVLSGPAGTSWYDEFRPLRETIMSLSIPARPMPRTLCVVLLGACLAPAHAASRLSALDDTGMTQCAVWDPAQERWKFTSHCDGIGQDPSYGRDASDPSNKDGRAGFSFEKIGENGETLPRKALAWRCVVDRTTGLEWEVKTADGSLFDYRNRYTHIGDGRSGDTSSYVTTVNAVGLCGANDWRLPSRGELESLLDYSRAGFSAMVDPDWFPNTLGDMHWTSSSSKVNGGGPGYWWAVNFLAGNSLWRGGEYDADSVRLVRGGVVAPARRWKIRKAEDGEVLDQRTHLVWRRCAEGRGWSGTTCTGPGTVFLEGTDATDHALAEAARTGKPWRVPNVKELSSLVDMHRNYPPIDPDIFPAFEVDSYHTGTFWMQNPVYDWRVLFADGQVTTDFWGGRLLLVRDAPAN